MILLRSLRPLVCTQALLCLLSLSALSLAQAQSTATATAPVPPPNTAASAPSLPGRPLWSDLSDSQHQALAPLSEAWHTMNEPHKRKWLALSQNFAQLSADEQSTLQGRMAEWAALSPQQRSAARLNFAGAKQWVPQEDKKAKWEAYQDLSLEVKQKLAEQQTKVVVGVAPAAKPIAARKLATIPAPSDSKNLPRIATDQAHPITLLPIKASALTKAVQTVIVTQQ